MRKYKKLSTLISSVFIGMSVPAHAAQALKELEGYVIDNAQAIVDAGEDRKALQRELQQQFDKKLQQLQEEKQQLKETVDKLITRLDQLTQTLKGYADTKASQAEQAAKAHANVKAKHLRQLTDAISVSTTGKAQLICSGRTTEGSTAWVHHGLGAFYVDIKTNGCGFTSTPIYISNLAGNGGNYLSTGGSSPYLRTVNGFRVYVYHSTVTPAQANGWGWHINWVAIGN